MTNIQWISADEVQEIKPATPVIVDVSLLEQGLADLGKVIAEIKTDLIAKESTYATNAAVLATYTTVPGRPEAPVIPVV